MIKQQKYYPKNTNQNSGYWLSFLFFVLSLSMSYGQLKDCHASLVNDTLLIGNNRIERKWLWNNGNLKAYSIKNIKNNQTILLDSSIPSFHIPKNIFQKNNSFKISTIKKSIAAPEHLEIKIINEYRDSKLKQVFKIFPKTPAISCEYFMKYNSLILSPNKDSSLVNGTEKGLNVTEKITAGYLDYYPLQNRHWKTKAVSFKDATDVNNNLVFEKTILPYKRVEKVIGNLLFVENLATKNHFFLLKEAPNGESQINYPKYDFSLASHEIKVPFSGFPNPSLTHDWVKGYSITSGVGTHKTNCLIALRTYLKNSLNYNSDEFDMVMMNTWGDRGQDGKINEKFILEELTEAQRLGISHFQIDDGWQQGLSSNSIYTSKNHWDDWTPESWKPNKERFPNGLNAIIKSAKEKNIKLGLWFNPSSANSYANWEADANVILDLYKTTGIKYYKIDGVSIKDKLAETNLTKFFDTLKKASNGEIFFNLDLTAGVRGGYFSFRPYGNLFLENRYTDWTNYYPFHTLRNLWMLSKYFPSELLQVEFLNIWRNNNKYAPDDPFAPSNYSFDYVFAITMSAQPLAWFEGTGLPQEAFTISRTIKKYREIQSDFHVGNIFPIGAEPSGRSWTGFQSIQEDHGYLLIFRENNKEDTVQLKTFLPPNSNLILEQILGTGNGQKIKTKVAMDGTLGFNLPKINSYVLYSYRFSK